MQVADEKLMINALGSYMVISSQQVRLGLSNFMQTKHAHEHFDLLRHVDIKTSKNENFSII